MSRDSKVDRKRCFARAAFLTYYSDSKHVTSLSRLRASTLGEVGICCNNQVVASATYSEDCRFNHVSKLELGNWIAIYGATGICCAFAMLLSVTTVARELWHERVWTSITNFRSAAALVPVVWWRWQKRYLLSTPVTLAIISAFALTLSWNN